MRTSGEHRRSFQRPLLHPVVMLIVFLLFLILLSGPAYNANALRAFLRESKFLEGSSNQELLLLHSVKIFQSTDLMLAGVVGLVIDRFGLRIAQCVGYISFGVSALLMMHWSSLWYGMLLQGTASVFLLYSSIHLANLFQRHSRIAISLLTSSSELGCIVYPVLNLAVTRFDVPARILLLILAGVSGLGLLVTLFLMPDQPFYPESLEAQARLRKVSLGLSSEQDVVTGKQPDIRDQWGPFTPRPYSPSQQAQEQQPPIVLETASLLPELATLKIHRDEGQRKLSTLSVSVVGMMDRDRPSVVSAVEAQPVSNKDGALAQLMSVENILFTLIFTFMNFRANLYLDGNEQILKAMGDVDEKMLRTLAYLMPLGIFPSLFSGVLIEMIGILPMAILINVGAMGVNVLSTVQWLNLQHLTFILFVCSRASCWNLHFFYTLGRFGLRNFGVLIGISSLFCGLMNLAFGTVVLNHVVQSGPEEWAAVNWGLTIGGAITCGALLYLLFLQLRDKHEG